MFNNFPVERNKRILVLNKRLESSTSWFSSLYEDGYSRLRLEAERKRSVFDIFWDQINGHTSNIEKSISVSECTNLNLSSVIHLGAFDVYM